MLLVLGIAQVVRFVYVSKKPQSVMFYFCLKVYILHCCPFLLLLISLFFASLFLYFGWELETKLTKGLSRSMFKAMAKHLDLVIMVSFGEAALLTY